MTYLRNSIILYLPVQIIFKLFVTCAVKFKWLTVRMS